MTMTQPIVRIQQQHLYFGAAILLVATPALAHRPYESAAGTFRRGDGTVISVVRQHVDGILGPDPVSVQFRLPNGTEVARTPYLFDALVRQVPSGIEVYEFRTTAVPIASRVEMFDGYALRDITSRRRSISTLIHLANHWVGYLVHLGLASLFVGFWLASRAIPNGGWRTALRGIGFVCLAIAGAFFLYDVLAFEPISPLVLAGCGLILAAVYRLGRRRTCRAGVG